MPLPTRRSTLCHITTTKPTSRGGKLFFVLFFTTTSYLYSTLRVPIAKIQSIPLHDAPNVALYKAIVSSGKPWSTYSREEKDLARAVDKKYPNLIKAPASSVAPSVASYRNSSYSSISGISMGGVSQTTIHSPSNLTDEQLAEAFNRTRGQYLQEQVSEMVSEY
jgi:hypothetical protein